MARHNYLSSCPRGGDGICEVGQGGSASSQTEMRRSALEMEEVGNPANLDGAALRLSSKIHQASDAIELLRNLNFVPLQCLATE
jgi:hypothetical protein